MLRLILSFLASLLLAGCNRSPPPASPAPGASPAATLSIAAAADLKFALDDLIKTYEIANPTFKITPTFGSSGNFYTQLTNGAPFDLFLSADIDYPQKLADANLAEKPFPYAIGRIVIWTRSDGPLDPTVLKEATLTNAAAKKIAIANPTHAPYGRAAVAALKSLNIYDGCASRLVFGDNISQAAQFAESGAADVGIIALSLATSPAMKAKGRFWEIPQDAYPKLIQGGAVIKASKNLNAATAFATFLQSPTARDILSHYGFSQP